MRDLTFDDIKERLEYLDFEVDISDTKDGKKQIELEKHSDAGQDCIFNIECDADKPSDIWKELINLYENYDPEAETMLWLGPDGHGKNGAPYSMRDLLEDMESVKEDLKNTSEYMNKFVLEFGNKIDWTKDEVKGKFLYNVWTLSDNSKNLEKSAVHICKQALDFTVNDIDGGSPIDKKKMILEYLTDIGITDDKPETFSAALTKAVSENKNDIELWKMISDCQEGIMKTTTPMMSSTEVKVHRMFDNFFNKLEGEDPYKTGHHDIMPCMNENNGWKWSKAVADYAQSGGYMFVDTYNVIKTLEKFGLIKNNIEKPELYGPCYDEYCKYMDKYGSKTELKKFDEFLEGFNNCNEMREYLSGNDKLCVEYTRYQNEREDKFVDKYYERADDIWNGYLYDYLKDLGVFNEKGRLEKKQAYENKHGYEGGR